MTDGPTNEARAETKLALAMPCKEEEDEIKLWQYAPERNEKMTKRRPNEQREQKPNLFGLCRVASEEEEFKHKYQAF